MFQNITNWLTSLDLLGFIGLSALIFAIAILVITVVRGCLSLVASMMRGMKTSRIRREEVIGPKLVIAEMMARDSGKWRSAISDTIDQHFGHFNFGCQFKVCTLSLGMHSTGAINLISSNRNRMKAERLLEKTGADLLLWGYGADAHGLELNILKRVKDGDAIANVILVPAAVKDGSEMGQTALGYLLAKSLKPTLSAPSTFKTDSIESAAKHLQAAVETGGLGFSADTLQEIEDDFVTGALHVASHTQSADWFEAIASLREKTLTVLKRDDDPDRWARAKVELGVAIAGLSRERFHAERLNAGMDHIREALNVLKAQKNLVLAEQALHTLAQAEETYAKRHRFAVRWR